MLKLIRRTLAIVSFTLITLLLLDFTGTLQLWIGWMATIQFLPALLALNAGIIVLLVILTFLFGRLYCSIVCPLGIFFDTISWMHNKKKKNRFTYSKAKNTLRYTLLTVLVIAFILGVNSLVALFAPYSAYGRIVNNLFEPIYVTANNLLATIGAHYESYLFYQKDIWIKSVPTLLITIVSFITFITLAWRNGRTYCNTLCPVGSILGFISRFSFFKVRINTEKCIDCKLCVKNCKSSCIDIKNHQIDYSRCVACGDCIDKCKTSALSYQFLSPKKKATSSAPSQTANNNKRMFLLTSTMAATSAFAARVSKVVDGGLAEIEDKKAPNRQTPITPPGSHSANNMAKHCTACQLCVTNCPNGVLRPSTNLLTLMQPTMSYEYGYCRPECTTCGEVCPTGAILSIKKDIKSSTQIGHAVWIRKNCLPISEGVACGNCARHCPTGAIQMSPISTESGAPIMIPIINTSRCIGCGACENLCPSRPYPAIYVEGHEVHKTI